MYSGNLINIELKTLIPLFSLKSSRKSPLPELQYVKNGKWDKVPFSEINVLSRIRSTVHVFLLFTTVHGGTSWGTVHGTVHGILYMVLFTGYCTWCCKKKTAASQREFQQLFLPVDLPKSTRGLRDFNKIHQQVLKYDTDLDETSNRIK